MKIITFNFCRNICFINIFIELIIFLGLFSICDLLCNWSICCNVPIDLSLNETKFEFQDYSKKFI